MSTIDRTDGNVRYFTTEEAAKLLGMQKEWVEELRADGEGPKYLGENQYVTYSAVDIKSWALDNIMAPTKWFERFDTPDPEGVSVSEVYCDDWLWRLCFEEEAKLILEMLRTAHFCNWEEYVLFKSLFPDNCMIVSGL